MNERKKVTVADIRAMKLGQTKTFRVPHPKNLQYARTAASSVGTLEPELGLRFTVKCDYSKCEITITAKKR